MKLISKALAFVKENKIITLALFIVLLSFIFLALPNQFAHFGPADFTSKVETQRWDYSLNGYQWMFGTVEDLDGNAIGGPVASGIAAFSMLVLCVPGLLFSKKSSFVSLLTSIALVVIAILFFTCSHGCAKAYGTLYAEAPKGEHWSIMRWVPYVLGSFIMLVGLLMCFRTFVTLKNEIKHPAAPKGPSYNYLHK